MIFLKFFSFDLLNDQTAVLPHGLDDTTDSTSLSLYEEISPDSDFTYVDFTRRGEKSQAVTLKSQVILLQYF